MKKILREIAIDAGASFVIKEEIAEQFSGPFHFYQGYEFAYIVNGRGKFYGGDRLMNFREGDLFLFGIGFPHYFINERSFVESGVLAHSVVIQFKDDFIGHDMYLKPEFKHVKALLNKAHWGIKINKPSNQLKKALIGAPKKHGLRALITLLQLLETVSSLPATELNIISSGNFESSSLGNKGCDKLEAVYKYVLENFKDDLSTKQAAGLTFMNESAFCRYFKRRTNKTLSQFINHVRVTHSIFLLAEKDTSVSKICYDCGFDNLSYFNRQFKLITGKSPLAYRKENL